MIGRIRPVAPDALRKAGTGTVASRIGTIVFFETGRGRGRVRPGFPRRDGG